MLFPRPATLPAVFGLILLILTCACTPKASAPRSSETTLPSNSTVSESQPTKQHVQQPVPDQTQPAEQPATSCQECESVAGDENRARCYKLQPGKKIKNKKGKTVTTRCEPQSVMYARCRSNVMTCRLGDTGPVEWYNCAKKNKAVTSTPTAGSIMVIDVNKRHGMPTGHLGYVEEVCPNPDGTWTLRFSHTNYDRKCHLDLDAKVIFNPKTMEANFITGHWSVWAKKLKICGFILR